MSVYCEEWVACMERVDEGGADLVLTDPPYVISTDVPWSGGGVLRLNKATSFGKWDYEAIDLLAFAKECWRVLRTGGTAIVFYDMFKLTHVVDALKEAGFGVVRLFIWEKTNPVPVHNKVGYLNGAREMGVTAVKKGKGTFHSQYDRGIYHLPIPPHDDGHPCQKPLGLMEQLVLKHSNPNALVVDPFCGSGTTLVACKKHNRRYLGGDVDPHWVDVAVNRVASTTGALL